MSEEQLEREVRDAAGAVKKPWWFVAVVLGLVVGTAFAAARAAVALDWRPEGSPLAGLIAGVLLAIAVLGHVPGKYRDARTGQYETFWSPQSRRVRGRCAIAAMVLLIIGMAIDHHYAAAGATGDRARPTVLCSHSATQRHDTRPAPSTRLARRTL